MCQIAYLRYRLYETENLFVTDKVLDNVRFRNLLTRVKVKPDVARIEMKIIDYVGKRLSPHKTCRSLLASGRM